MNLNNHNPNLNHNHFPNLNPNPTAEIIIHRLRTVFILKNPASVTIRRRGVTSQSDYRMSFFEQSVHLF